MEYAMKFLLTSTALGLALAAGATAAQAQQCRPLRPCARYGPRQHTPHAGKS
jgi:hypothetical protein